MYAYRQRALYQCSYNSLSANIVPDTMQILEQALVSCSTVFTYNPADASPAKSGSQKTKLEDPCSLSARVQGSQHYLGDEAS